MRPLRIHQSQQANPQSISPRASTISQRSDPAATPVAGGSGFNHDFSRIPLHSKTSGLLQRQMMPEGKQPDQTPGNPKEELLHRELETILEEKAEIEKFAGPMARQLARAYLGRRPDIRAPEQLHATPYAADRLSHEEWSEDELFQALLNAVDVKQISTLKPKMDWHRKSNETAKADTRGSTAFEITKATSDYFLGGHDIEGILKGQAMEAMEHAAATYAARWLEKKGLALLIEIGSVVESLHGIYETVCSVLELLIILQKPERKVSKADIIVAEVRDWLALQSGAPKALPFQTFRPEFQTPVPATTDVRGNTRNRFQR